MHDRVKGPSHTSITLKDEFLEVVALGNPGLGVPLVWVDGPARLDVAPDFTVRKRLVVEVQLRHLLILVLVVHELVLRDPERRARFARRFRDDLRPLLDSDELGACFYVRTYYERELQFVGYDTHRCTCRDF